MKKTLTEDISRYDDKMRLRLDGATARALGIAAVPSLLLGVALYKISFVLAVSVALTVFVVVTLLQIGVTDGMPLREYVLAMLRQMSRKKLPYLKPENTDEKEQKR